MTCVGRRKSLYFSAVVLLIIFTLQIWACCEYRTGTMRIFPGNGVAPKTTAESQGMTKERKDKMVRKLLNGRSFGLNRTDEGFEESKRRVPSCPDPLHN
ncbi:hypothetical protein SLA2020_089660 [Shorea laevis]